MIIILVGESASGKTTIQNYIVKKNPKWSKIISYTTRPIRDGEKPDIDYHYVSKEDFKNKEENNFFLESATYRNWNYGSAISDYFTTENKVVVLTPHGYRSLKKYFAEKGFKDFVCFYINVDRRSRLIKILERGDDIDEAYRRNISDVGQFDGFETEADYILYNSSYKKDINQIYKEIILYVSSFSTS